MIFGPVTGDQARSRLVACAAGVGGLAGGLYWLFMSPYSQTLGPFPYRVASTERVVALTFDDGPNEPYTSQIADFLDDRGVPATFFQVGRAVVRHPDVTARLAASGHTIGHHGYTHHFTRYLRSRTLDTDLRQGLDAFADVGLRPRLYRPPWLLRIPPLWRICRRHGLQVVSGQFCHPLEVFQPGADRIARHALARTSPGSILIFHDGVDGRGGNRASTVDAVKIVVDQLIDRGYHFTTVDGLLPTSGPPGRAQDNRTAQAQHRLGGLRQRIPRAQRPTRAAEPSDRPHGLARRRGAPERTCRRGHHGLRPGVAGLVSGLAPPAVRVMWNRFTRWPHPFSTTATTSPRNS